MVGHTSYIVRWRPCSVKKFPSHRPEILHREALVGAPTVPIHPLSSRNFLITGRTFHARICGSGTRPHDPLYIFHYIRGGPCSGKCFHHRPTQNPPPEAFGWRARRPTRASLWKLYYCRPNLLCPYLWLGHAGAKNICYPSLGAFAYQNGHSRNLLRYQV